MGEGWKGADRASQKCGRSDPTRKLPQVDVPWLSHWTRCCRNASKRSIRRKTSARSKGFNMKSLAPAFNARTLVSSFSSAVSTITGREPQGGLEPSASRMAKPSTNGIIRSSKTKSGSNVRHNSRAMRESVIAFTFWYSLSARIVSSSSAFTGSSSITKIFDLRKEPEPLDGHGLGSLGPEMISLGSEFTVRIRGDFPQPGSLVCRWSYRGSIRRRSRNGAPFWTLLGHSCFSSGYERACAYFR